MSYDHAIYCQQIGLKTLGFDPGPADGLDGPTTRAALMLSERARFGAKAGNLPVPRPGPSYRDKVRVFGEPGREEALKRVTLPWPMKIAWGGGTRKTIRMHRLIADQMIAALEEIKSVIGMSGVRRYGLDQFGGDYINRKSRGGNSVSDHAWGIALDLSPSTNGLWTKWEPEKLEPSGHRQISKQVVKIFRRYGFQVGFRRADGSRRDMMHIAYVDRE